MQLWTIYANHRIQRLGRYNSTGEWQEIKGVGVTQGPKGLRTETIVKGSVRYALIIWG